MPVKEPRPRGRRGEESLRMLLIHRYTCATEGAKGPENSFLTGRHTPWAVLLRCQQLTNGA